MTTTLDGSPAGYVQALDLPAAGPTLEAARNVRFTVGPEGVAVGSQLVGFTGGVPPGLRGTIADSILLAQLAANKAATDSPDVFRWYDKYVEVLQHVGWQLREVEFQSQSLSDGSASLHEAIVPVIAGMLGPQAGTSLVLNVLKSLRATNPATPWLTLFERSSRLGHGAKFQVGYVDANGRGEPAVTLACFGVNAATTVTQVLFFKHAAQSAELKKAAGTMTANLARLEAARDAIADRVGPFVADYVAKLDI